MWTTKAADRLIDGMRLDNRALQSEVASINARCQRFETENTRLLADLEWFKHRLSAVEKERAQLISAAIGVKIAVPEFLPSKAPDMADTFNELPDFRTVGGDADDPSPLGQELEPDFTLMPGYRASTARAVNG